MTGQTEGLRERKRASTRAATADAALRLFAEQGYEAVTVAAICAAAQIAPRTFFRYFATKDDVLAEPAREMSARVGASIADAPAGLGDDEAVAGALRELAGYVLAHQEQLVLLRRVANGSAAVRASPFLHLAGRERDLAEQLLRRRGEQGPADWRTRLVVARSVAGFRVWLDDVMAGEVPGDPLAHLDEVLAAG